MTRPIVTLSELSDDPAPGKSKYAPAFSPRLDAVLSCLPTYAGCRVPIANALCNAEIFTVAALCQKKRDDLKRWKNFGKKSLGDLESTLALFGLAIADVPTPIGFTRIHLSLQQPNGSRSEITSTFVTPVMLEAAEDLLQTLTTGERPPPKGLYELCASAFGTTRDDAKQRLLGAMYGKPGKAIES